MKKQESFLKNEGFAVNDTYLPQIFALKTQKINKVIVDKTDKVC